MQTLASLLAKVLHHTALSSSPKTPSASNSLDPRATTMVVAGTLYASARSGWCLAKVMPAEALPVRPSPFVAPDAMTRDEMESPTTQCCDGGGGGAGGT